MNNLAIRFLALLGFVFLASTSLALTPGPDDVYVRVIDVGAGECCVIRLPGGHNVIFDAGFGKVATMKSIREVLPGPEDGVDLLVLSHTDQDHLGAVPLILAEHEVDRVLRTGMEPYGGRSAVLESAIAAIEAEKSDPDFRDHSLAHIDNLPHGYSFVYGEARVTFVSGFGEVPEDWKSELGNAKPLLNNAPSIVIRVEYRGRSMLFCGDAVGRTSGDLPNAAAIASERYMLEHQAQVPLRSDVLVAAHHGADNASSQAFIQAVAPSHVIFTAGNLHGHPRQATAQRFLDANIPKANMYRTDFGSDGEDEEWDYGNDEGDARGDDDVEVLLTGTGAVRVAYRSAANQALHEHLSR